MFRRAFKSTAYCVVWVAALVAWPGQSFAAMQSVTAHIAFETPLSLTKVSDIDFGTISAGTADTYTISTSGVVTAAGGGEQVSGTPTAGNITVAGSATQSVDIIADNYTPQNGVSLQNATCSYGGAAAVPCNISNAPASGASTTLLVGVEAVVDGTQIAGMTAFPSFTLTVVYQ